MVEDLSEWEEATTVFFHEVYDGEYDDKYDGKGWLEKAEVVIRLILCTLQKTSLRKFLY